MQRSVRAQNVPKTAHGRHSGPNDGAKHIGSASATSLAVAELGGRESYHLAIDLVRQDPTRMRHVAWQSSQPAHLRVRLDASNDSQIVKDQCNDSPSRRYGLGELQNQ
jgi:hypothetical protein